MSPPGGSSSSLHACEQRGEADWKNTQKVRISEETEFRKIAISEEVTTDFENLEKRQAETKACGLLDMYHKAIPYKASSVRFATAHFHPFHIIPVWMQNGIHETKIIHENVIKSLYWWFKRTGNFEIIGIVVLSTQLHEELQTIEILVLLGH